MARKARGRGESKYSKRRLKDKQRQAQALDLRISGKTYQQIANDLGYATEAGAYKAIEAALRSTMQPLADEVRRLELQRLDAMHEALWLAVREPETCKAIGPRPAAENFKHVADFDKALMGWEQARLGAFEKLLKIQERRAKLLGLDAPKKVESSGPGGGPLVTKMAISADLASMTDDDLDRLISKLPCGDASAED